MNASQQQNATITDGDAEEEARLYQNRPRNHSPTLPFADLYESIFNPLNNVRKKPTGPLIARKKQGPHGPTNESPAEAKVHILERFVSKWRKQVGNDIFPAFRLIVPDKDRERGMYGLKEKTIGKILVRILKIDKNSEDGFKLINWKLPGQKYSGGMAGDFAGRCFEVISKRAMRTEPGGMLIEEVNDLLDKLSVAGKEDEQLQILQGFYNRMNAEEMMWLIRIILRQMKIGASERTLFHIWHPDAEILFNISSNLKRVCWELVDPAIRLHQEQSDLSPMSCFQPQLAAFNMHSLEKQVARMRPTENDRKFWIEDKLDGERMQLHMVEDSDHPGGYKFGFWSRKAKDYTYLYGNGYQDTKSALTRHLKGVFDAQVHSIILDGEMVTWDIERDKIVDFGTLKTAALAAQNNEYSNGHRPLYKVFDILYLNDKPLAKYTLRDRRNALEASVRGVSRRLEIHPYTEGESEKDIEPLLRDVIENAGEGLVLKNPRSAYALNERNDNWIKVKPEYMTDFGEELDCIVIGGNYGSGRRGGGLSSFMCGLRASPRQIARGYAPNSVLSFCRVGGGMTAADYQTIKHLTEGKWRDWDRANPPTKHIRIDPPGLADAQPERPDVWIMPEDSFVISIKAASVLYGIKEYGTGFTLRFPRFKRLRQDKSFATALTVDEFEQQRDNMEKERRERSFVVDDARRKRLKRTTRKKELVVAGADTATALATAQPAADDPQIFAGLSMHIMTDAAEPEKMSRAELEGWAKRHGAQIFASARAAGSKALCIANRRLVTVQGLQNQGHLSIVRPSWLFDCVRQAKLDIQAGRSPVLLPFEPRHMYFVAEKDQVMVAAGVDRWGDSYSRDVASVEEMREILEGVGLDEEDEESGVDDLVLQLEERGVSVREGRGALFDGLSVHFLGWNGGSRIKEEEEKMDVDEDEEDRYDCDAGTARRMANYVEFGMGTVLFDPENPQVTHIVVTAFDEASLRRLRRSIAGRKRLPHIVTSGWIEESWREETLIDEDRFKP